MNIKVLGIETSCDETSIAVVDDDRQILSNVVLSQVAEHSPYGGVVPEIAARAHLKYIPRILDQALDEAKITLKDIDAIAVTAGPGLIGGLMVGVMFAKAMAAALDKPIIAVNHLEGHALTARLSDGIAFPYLLLLVSGGHCQFVICEGLGQYRRIGTTIDDAAGEAFDKVAKMLGLGMPGGPLVEKMALDGDTNRFKLPVSLKGRAGCDFSFSGLKTAVKREIDAIGNLSERDKSDICASFQHTAGEIFLDRLRNAFGMVADSRLPVSSNLKENHQLVLAGGVAANQYLRGIISELCADNGYRLIAPPIRLCTDNAAMIAWAGMENFLAGNVSDLSFAPKARWPL
jgi:N6-L-threonylcarbamoyladenine synthase